MKVLLKFSLDFLKKNLRWTLTSIFSIILAITLVTGVVIFGFSVIQSNIEGAKKSSDGFIIQQQYVDHEVYQNLQDYQEISKLEATPILNKITVIDRYAENEMAYFEQELISINDVKPDLQEGRYPVNEDEVLISYFRLNTAKNNILETTDKNYQVVGVFKDNELTADYFNSAFTLSDQEPQGYKVKIALNDPSKENYQELKNIMNEPHPYLSYYGEVLGLEQGSVDGTEAFMSVVVTTILVIIFLSAYFVINNAFNIASTQQVYTFSQLFSVGATYKQQGLIILFEALIVGIIGIGLGIGFGLLSSQTLISLITSRLPFFDDTFGVYYPGWILPVIFILGLLVVIMSSLRPIFQVSNASVIETLRFNRKFKLKKAPHWVKKQDFVTQFAYKNYSVSKKQFNKVLIGLTLSITLFVTISSLTSILYDDLNKSQPTISLHGVGNGETVNDVMEVLPSDLDFNHVTKNYLLRKSLETSTPSTNWNLNNMDLMVEAFDDETFKSLFKSDMPIIINLIESYDNGQSEIVKGPINEPNNLTTVIFHNRENNESEAVLVRVIDSYHEDLKPYMFFKVIMPYSYTLEHPFFETDYYDISFTVDNYQVEMDQQLRDAIDGFYEDVYLNNGYENNRITTNVLSMFNLGVNIFVVMIALISLSNIFNTLTTQFIFRAKEFSLLEAVGATQKQLRRIVLVESIITIVRAVVWGFIISLAIFVLINLVAINYNVSTRLYPQVGSFIIVLIVLIVSVVSISLYSLNLLKRQNLMDKLKQQF